MPSPRLGTVMLGAAVLLGGCSMSSPHWSTREAATQYEMMTVPVDRNLTALARLPSDATITDRVASCRALVDSNGALIDALRKGNWAPELKPFVDDAITSAEGEQSWYEACAGARSFDELDALGKISASNPKPQAVATLREQLGLPPTG